MSQPRIAVVDYGAGNILNVLRALEHLNTSPELVDSPHSLHQAAGIIIPGVGAFGAGMHGLEITGMDNALRESFAQEVPLFAICLGMQLLASSSEESPGVAGLGLIDGHVRKLQPQVNGDGLGRVPDTGWARVTFNRPSAGFPVDKPHNFYFSHSYYFDPSDSSVVSGTKAMQTTEIPALLEHRNILAAQFHPEKSGPHGIALIKTWIESKVTQKSM